MNGQSRQYEQIAASLAKLQFQRGGSQAQRNASCALMYACLHVEMVELSRALRREDFDSRVVESTSEISLRMNGTCLTIQRFSSQSQLKVEMRGFDSRVIPPEGEIICYEVATLSYEEAVAFARETMDALGAALRREIAIRSAS